MKESTSQCSEHKFFPKNCMMCQMEERLKLHKPKKHDKFYRRSKKKKEKEIEIKKDKSKTLNKVNYTSRENPSEGFTRMLSPDYFNF